MCLVNILIFFLIDILCANTLKLKHKRRAHGVSKMERGHPLGSVNVKNS